MVRLAHVVVRRRFLIIGLWIVLTLFGGFAAGQRDTAIVETMRHAGRSVIVSGSTVAVGLLSLIILPLLFIGSIGIGGMLIPAVSVLTAITLLPALLYTLGPRINSLRVLPRRLVEGSDDPDAGFGRNGRRRTAPRLRAPAQPGRRPGA